MNARTTVWYGVGEDPGPGALWEVDTGSISVFKDGVQKDAPFVNFSLSSIDGSLFVYMSPEVAREIGSKMITAALDLQKKAEVPIPV